MYCTRVSNYFCDVTPKPILDTTAKSTSLCIFRHVDWKRVNPWSTVLKYSSRSQVESSLVGDNEGRHVHMHVKAESLGKEQLHDLPSLIPPYTYIRSKARTMVYIYCTCANTNPCQLPLEQNQIKTTAAGH